jgi:hypothetical protein
VSTAAAVMTVAAAATATTAITTYLLRCHGRRWRLGADRAAGLDLFLVVMYFIWVDESDQAKSS